MSRVNRRSFLVVAGTGAVAGLAGISGCTSNSGSTTETTTATEQTTETGDDQTTTTASAGEITAGMTLGLTGQYSSLTEPLVEVTKMVEAEVNEAGGIGDQGFTVNIQNDNWTPQGARENVQKFINVDQVPVIFGISSAQISPIWDMIQDTQIPVISGWPNTQFLDTHGGDNGTPEDISDDEWLWRLVPSDSISRGGLAYYLTNEKGAKTVNAILGSSAEVRSAYGAFKKGFTGFGGSVNKELKIRQEQRDFQTLIQQAHSGDPDVIHYELNLEDFAALTRQEQNMGMSDAGNVVRTTTEANVTESFIESNGESYHDGFIAPKASGSGPYYDTWKSRYNDYTDVALNSYTPLFYDTITVGALAMQRAKIEYGEVTRENIEKSVGPVGRPDGIEVNTFTEGKRELEAGNEINFNGAGSFVNFTPKGDISASVAVQQIADGASSIDTLKEYEQEFVRENILPTMAD